METHLESMFFVRKCTQCLVGFTLTQAYWLRQLQFKHFTNSCKMRDCHDAL